MGDDFGARLIRAFQAGQQHKMQRERMAQEQEDRKLRQEMLSHQLRTEKLNEKLSTRKMMLDEAMQFGPQQQPIAGMPDTGNVGMQGHIGAGLPGAPAGGLPIVRELQSGTTEEAPLNLPGVEELGIPGRQVRVSDMMRNIMQQQRMKSMNDPRVITEQMRIDQANQPVNVPNVEGLPLRGQTLPRIIAPTAISAAARAQEGQANRTAAETRLQQQQQFQDMLNRRTNAVRLRTAGMQAAATASNRNNQLENTLRDDYRDAIKDIQYPTVASSISRIEASAKNPSPAGDLSMIFNYMRLLDPTSVVRESEFRVAQNAKPMIQRLGLDWNAVESVWAGRKLTDVQRADFLNRARETFREIDGMKQTVDQQYGKLAQDKGIDPSRVIITASPGGAGGAQPIIQQNQRTGEYRHSLDGGKTWQSGRP